MKKQQGFTLIELLVVIAIIGVMSALVIVNLSSANKKSRDSRRKADLSELRTALELYYDDYLQYPSTSYATVDSALPTHLVPTYMKELPQDPRNANAYVYSYVSDGNAYTLAAALEEGGPTAYSVYSSN